MPTAKITVPSAYDPPETFARVKHLLETAPELRKLDSSVAFEFDDAKLRGSARGRHFRADMRVKEAKPQATVRVSLELPLLLGMFLGEVRRNVEAQLIAAVGEKTKKKFAKAKQTAKKSAKKG